MATEALEPAVAKADTAAASAAASQAQSAARGAWSKLSDRDRRLVTIAAVALGALILWLAAIRPALGALSDATQRLPAMETQLQEMQRLAIESRELKGAPRIQPSQAQAALKTATDTLGGAGKLALAGERATLTLTNANGEQLRRWLVDARTTARARPIEAKLSRSAQGYSGTVVVALPATN